MGKPNARSFIVDFLVKSNRPVSNYEIHLALSQFGIDIKKSSLNWALTHLNTAKRIRRWERGLYVSNEYYAHHKQENSETTSRVQEFHRVLERPIARAHDKMWQSSIENNQIPLVGRPDGHHICTSTIGIGCGIVGVTAVFVPYRGNYGRTPESLSKFLGWTNAEILGAGEEALNALLKLVRDEFDHLGIPDGGIDSFLGQLRTEPWISISASPLNSRPLPDDATAIIRHPERQRLFGISTAAGIIFFFVGATLGGPIEQIGSGLLSEATGIENFEEYGRDLWKDGEKNWSEIYKKIGKILSEKRLLSLKEDEPIETSAEPRIGLRPEDEGI